MNDAKKILFELILVDFFLEGKFVLIYSFPYFPPKARFNSILTFALPGFFEHPYHLNQNAFCFGPKNISPFITLPLLPLSFSLLSMAINRFEMDAFLSVYFQIIICLYL